MAETAVPRVRIRARTLAFVVPVLLVAVGLMVACVETKSAVGDQCLKSEDCLSGICSQLVCVAAPPTTDTQANGDGSASTPETGSGADAPAETSSGDDGAPEASSSSGSGSGSGGGTPEAAPPDGAAD